jgi:diguanylate cyclase (GGDEF)-like protein
MVEKILVVDDEPSLQEMLKDILSLADFDVVTASNGEEGLRRIYEDSPDLIILDCSMPVMDGYEMLERMRRDPVLVNKPVIMLSVRSGEYDEIKGLRLGVDDYITKPFKASLLLARVRAILERKVKSISANPLTFLSGNAVIKTEVEKRIGSGAAFAMLYVDLNNFKSFNDKYGFQRGDEVIKHTAKVLTDATRLTGNRNDFVGHIGGDDFIVLTTPEKYEKIAQSVIGLFDASIADYYDVDDRKQGFIVSKDRNNIVQKFTLMTISVAIVSTLNTNVTHYGQLSQIAAELKKVAKESGKSTFVVNRRKE